MLFSLPMRRLSSYSFLTLVFSEYNIFRTALRCFVMVEWYFKSAFLPSRAKRDMSAWNVNQPGSKRQYGKASGDQTKTSNSVMAKGRPVDWKHFGSLQMCKISKWGLTTFSPSNTCIRAALLRILYSAPNQNIVIIFRKFQTRPATSSKIVGMEWKIFQSAKLLNQGV